ncbi:MAG: hypothetical protein CL609_23050 [Anaerolineaceae bacterium]|nr:hypothetical protein [Anaerolineaceae bacterium]
MRKIAFLVFLTGLFILSANSSVRGVQAASGDEPYAGTPLCLPEVYPIGTTDCLPYGPSGMLKSLAEKGIPYPMRELPVVTPDPALGTAPDLYLKVGDQAFPVYASLADAEARNPTRYMDAGMKFLTYYERVDTDNGVYYRLTNGLWVEAGEADTSRYATWMRLFGLFFYQNPVNDFGWIIDQADVRTGPGYSAALTGKSLPRETVVQVYDMVNQDGTDWYMIGWNEWVERRQIRQFHVNLVPPEGVDNNRWIDINLYEQTLGIYEDGNLIYATLIASGLDPFFTRPGLFQIYKKLEKGDMSGAFEADRSDYYYLQNVPYTLYYDEARAIHGAYWRTMFGYPQSHGCVNVSIGDASIVFDWAEVGDWVHVWDPSGETPTDENLYTAGGA